MIQGRTGDGEGGNEEVDGGGSEIKERSIEGLEGRSGVDGRTRERLVGSSLPSASLLETRTFQHQGQLPLCRLPGSIVLLGHLELGGSFG